MRGEGKNELNFRSAESEQTCPKGEAVMRQCVGMADFQIWNNSQIIEGKPVILANFNLTHL